MGNVTKQLNSKPKMFRYICSPFFKSRSEREFVKTAVYFYRITIAAVKMQAGTLSEIFRKFRFFTWYYDPAGAQVKMIRYDVR